MEKGDAIIRVVFRINPDTLSDDEWAQRFREWQFVEQLRMKHHEITFKKALTEVLNEFSKGASSTDGTKKWPR
ncbi:hypothetical protein LS482_16195 [Sinomicrobium kalidii]|uniref:hypothetical protein n=1 Tax=Sinomicrobium kalidii TaxID=2900738 RepID=UPI001E53788D|nr:hypothetical protein [Sinomicrobium kalidii]UGU15214.1 hypothetical protein LS482_16195 [Sinomicrobium kalidii]